MGILDTVLDRATIRKVAATYEPYTGKTPLGAWMNDFIKTLHPFAITADERSKCRLKLVEKEVEPCKARSSMVRPSISFHVCTEDEAVRITKSNVIAPIIFGTVYGENDEHAGYIHRLVIADMRELLMTKLVKKVKTPANTYAYRAVASHNFYDACDTIFDVGIAEAIREKIARDAAQPPRFRRAA